jgi:hypothetical protein
MFTDPIKVRVNKEEATVSISIRTTDAKVEVFTFPLYVFEQVLAQYKAAVEDDENG